MVNFIHGNFFSAVGKGRRAAGLSARSSSAKRKNPAFSALQLMLFTPDGLAYKRTTHHGEGLHQTGL
jgi:hypothetical protein